MDLIASMLGWIPALPMGAAAVLALTPRGYRRFASTLAIAAMAGSFCLSVMAFAATLQGGGDGGPLVQNWTWFSYAVTQVKLGWVLDPLGAMMAVMITLVGALIFIYSTGYMAEDPNYTRFFCFLSLFAGAMLGLILANSLLLLFICWELVGVASYLLIGFWFEKPAAAAAAKKAFITTRIGDMGLLLGMLWLYSETGTSLFYDGGAGCLETGALTRMAAQTTVIGLALPTVIGLLIFCGAAGKSGQVPLHVWLPDAMEGPTPVSALIHAATMVAAGVFLVARVYPLLDADIAGVAGQSTALSVVTWVGAVTALFAACIAVGQTDIKRILAYSTVSQLGYMMAGIGMGGPAVGMFHLITHAFFKALLFMGAGSVIHGCNGEQDIRRMGGLRKQMPVTFATYAVGMMALSGVPLLFSGFWSKDEILHAGWGWAQSRTPFYLLWAGAFLTAFYMTRQMAYVFAGRSRAENHSGANGHGHGPSSGHAHESPRVMTTPLIVLAVFTVLLGAFGTPAWPWFHGYISGHAAEFSIGNLFSAGFLWIAVLSTASSLGGILLGWIFYGLLPAEHADEADPLERMHPGVFGTLRDRFYVDELYEGTVVKWNAMASAGSAWMDRNVWDVVVLGVTYVTLGLSWVNRLVDEFVINKLFDLGCGRTGEGGRWTAQLQNGQVQHYLRVMGLAVTVLLLVLAWGCGS